MINVSKKRRKGGENGGQPRPQWPGCYCRKMSCLNGSRKFASQKIWIVPIIGILGPNRFSARSAIFCRYWTCTFSGSLRNAALSAFEEGAPFMGTALAEYRQCIGPRLSAFSPSLKKSYLLKNISQIFGDIAENPYLCCVEI